MDSLIPALIIFLLLLLNALFTAAEFAIIGAPRASIERLATQGNKTAKTIRRILNDPCRQDRYIATAQLGITFASLGLGMYGEHVLAVWFANQLDALGTSKWIAAHATASLLAITILTYFHIVLGEMVPKSIALQNAEKTVLKVTPIMIAVKTALFPLVILLNGIGNSMLKLWGVDRRTAAGQYHTSEELRYIVAESTESGMLSDNTGDVLQELFDFTELDAAEVMVPRVHMLGIPLDADVNQIKEIVSKSRHTRYPVYDGDMDHIVGVLHIKDILRLLMARSATTGPMLSNEVLQPVPFVPEASKLDSVLKIMRKAHSQMVVVMDEHGGTSGLVAIEDLFEEVIGTVGEEQPVIPPIHRDENGILHVVGTVRLDEVGEEFDIELEHEDVDTVSGLVLTLLERPPSVGDTITYNGLIYEVTAIEGHGVAECIVKHEPEQS
jgi:CBS domain containing-hemolysin-like protein